jgi:hypothetical protein
VESAIRQSPIGRPMSRGNGPRLSYSKPRAPPSPTYPFLLRHLDIFQPSAGQIYSPHLGICYNYLREGRPRSHFIHSFIIFRPFNCAPAFRQVILCWPRELYLDERCLIRTPVSILTFPSHLHYGLHSTKLCVYPGPGQPPLEIRGPQREG